MGDFENTLKGERFETFAEPVNLIFRSESQSVFVAAPHHSIAQTKMDIPQKLKYVLLEGLIQE